MESERGVEPATLPLDLIERVLSFLSVPELCRTRLVCKVWNHILTKPGFHDAYDVNGKNKYEYLFMWCESIRRERLGPAVSPAFSDTLHFLDVNAKRWYSIPFVDRPRICSCGRELESRFISMREGLVCELTSVKVSRTKPCNCTGPKFALAISDPIAKTRKMLPIPPDVLVYPGKNGGHTGSLILTAVDGATRSYKVFLFNNIRKRTAQAQAKLFVHDSLTDEWRALQTPGGVDDAQAMSAVILDNSLFVLKRNNIKTFSYSASLFRYNFKEETWAEVYHMYFPRALQYAQLGVSGNRLFLNVWIGHERSSDPIANPRSFDDPGLASDPECPHPVAIHRYPKWPETDTSYELYEILVADYRRKLVVAFTDAQLAHIFELSDFGTLGIDLHLAFPRVGSNGICNSVVLVRNSYNREFEIRKYDLTTSSVELLPPHPFSEPAEAKVFGDIYFGSSMTLSLKNLLAPPPS